MPKVTKKSTGGKTNDTVVEFLRSSLTNGDVLHEPWTFGVIQLAGADTALFYQRQDGTPSFLTLGSNTSAQVDDLSNACQPATFGLNQKDVLDETYRKAGKIDAGNFLWGFNPDTGDFASKLASGLFPWGSLDKGIRFELYKLNVYGKGSFFKAHQDTPRGEDMFGSLVVVLPFDHEGGSLVLRHNSRECKFDGPTLLKDAPPVSAAYIAFFSDVEHEVAQVTSGHRVTVTYNLYFDSNKGAPVTQALRDPQPEHPFKIALKACLDNAATQPIPPHLGFGLTHAYPIKSALSGSKSLNLKGSDATLIQTLSELNIKHGFYLLYRESDNSQYYCPFRVLSKVILDGCNEEVLDTESSFDYIAGQNDSFLVWDKGPKKAGENNFTWPPPQPWYARYRRDEKRYKSIDIEWITEPKEEFLDRDSFLAYGNEAHMAFHYHQLCIVATTDSQKGEA